MSSISTISAFNAKFNHLKTKLNARKAKVNAEFQTKIQKLEKSVAKTNAIIDAQNAIELEKFVTGEELYRVTCEAYQQIKNKVRDNIAVSFEELNELYNFHHKNQWEYDAMPAPWTADYEASKQQGGQIKRVYKNLGDTLPLVLYAGAYYCNAQYIDIEQIIQHIHMLGITYSPATVRQCISQYVSKDLKFGRIYSISGTTENGWFKKTYTIYKNI